MKKLLILLSIISIGTFQSCKKEPVANISTDTITISPSEWSYNSTTYMSKVTKTSDITSNIALNNSVILAYIQLPNSTIYQALPTQIFNRFDSFGDPIYDFWAYNVGPLGIEFQLTNNYFSNPTPTGNVTIKLISLYNYDLENNPNIDLTNYEEVKEAFDIAE